MCGAVAADFIGEQPLGHCEVSKQGQLARITQCSTPIPIRSKLSRRCLWLGNVPAAACCVWLWKMHEVAFIFSSII
jgi:hypothetical protein